MSELSRNPESPGSALSPKERVLNERVAGAHPTDRSRLRSFSRPSYLLIIGALLLAVLATGGVVLWMSGQGGSQFATATVDGVEYGVSVARSLRVPPDLVSKYGTATSITGGLDLDGTSVYTIRGIDPTLALLAKLKPGAHDDVGPLGEYAVLARGSGLEELCPYFDSSGEGVPTVCD